MEVVLEPGKYVLAVSGGVDSMVLLDLLTGQKGFELVVAHFDHGIRADSDEDRRLVQDVAAAHGLPFEFAAGELGPGTSEAAARTARYAFLRQVKAKHAARAIITAHHQDDLIETALLNLLRGTGHKGLSALRSHDDLVRPLLNTTKQQLREYATRHNLRWREDSTNADPRYLRNYLRLHVLPRLSPAERQKLLTAITKASVSSAEIETVLDHMLPTGDSLDRHWFAALPHAVAREVMAAWLRRHEVRDFDRPLIERLVVAAKVAAPGTKIDINHSTILQISKNTTQIIARPSRQKA